MTDSHNESMTLSYEHYDRPLHRRLLPDEITKTTDPDAMRQEGSPGNAHQGAMPLHLPKHAYDQAEPARPHPAQGTQEIRSSQLCKLRRHWLRDYLLRTDLHA